ncbi:MAG: CopD family protein [Dehalococcoidia bacterium]|nr:CopD family protein [Dehalococcoidia bacterium]
MRPFVLVISLAAPLALVALLLTASRAEAHALLVRSDPPENAELRVAPDRIIGFFSENLDERLSSIEVLNGTGDRVDDGETAFGPERKRMSIGLKEALPPGFYTVVWETLSSVDGHLFKGSYPFTVLNQDGSQPSGPRFEVSGGGSASTGIQNYLVKWAQLLGITALVGSLAFVLWVSGPASAQADATWRAANRTAVRRRLRWIVMPALALLFLVAGGELLLQADQLGGFKYVNDVLKNDWGERWIQRQIVLVAIAVALGAGFGLSRAARYGLSAAAFWLALLGGFGYLLLVAMISHGAAVPGSAWAVGADFLHLSSSAVWIGMLAMLALYLLWLRSDVPEAQRETLEAEHLQHFSTFAATSVVVLLATGTINGLTEIPDLSSMIDTAYGRSLAIKLALMVGLLAVAGVNAFYLRPRIVDEEDDDQVTPSATRRRLRYTVLAEIALALAVLFMAAVLIQHTTARQIDEVEETRAAQQQGAQAVVGYESIQPAGDLQVNLTVSPNTPGQNSFRVFLFPRQGGDIKEVLRVRLRFQKQGGDLGVSDLVLEPAGATAWRGVGPFLSGTGNWTVSVDVRRANVDDVMADFPVPVTTGERAGGDFDFPLAVGSWLTVAAIVMLVLLLLAAIWLTDLPGLPEVPNRLLRVGTATFTVVGVGLLAISFLPGEKELTGNPIASTPESIAIGRTLYVQNCQSCHGQNGRGDGPLAPTLAVPPADFRVHIPYHQDEFFFRVMTNGLGTIMPPFGDQLTEDERWHILNFLQSEFGAKAQAAQQ